MINCKIYNYEAFFSFYQIFETEKKKTIIAVDRYFSTLGAFFV